MKKYLHWHGRMNRKTYALLSLSLFIWYLIARTVDIDDFPALLYINDVMMYLKLVWNAQRLHDFNRSGAWTLIVIPLIFAAHAGPIISLIGYTLNSIFFVYLLFAKGTVGENAYGSDPLASKKGLSNDVSAAE